MPELQKLRASIEEIITEDTTWCKSIMVMRQQECFAVRPGTDGNLDAMRTVSIQNKFDTILPTKKPNNVRNRKLNFPFFTTFTFSLLYRYIRILSKKSTN